MRTLGALLAVLTATPAHAGNTPDYAALDVPGLLGSITDAERAEFHIAQATWKTATTTVPVDHAYILGDSSITCSSPSSMPWPTAGVLTAFDEMVRWVEEGIAPGPIDFGTPAAPASTIPATRRPRIAVFALDEEKGPASLPRPAGPICSTTDSHSKAAPLPPRPARRPASSPAWRIRR